MEKYTETHDAIYLCKSYANKGHHIVYKDDKPWEGVFVEPKEEKDGNN